MYEPFMKIFGIFAFVSATGAAAYAVHSPRDVNILISIDEEIQQHQVFQEDGQETPISPDDYFEVAGSGQEYNVTLNFDDVHTNGARIWPDGYGQLEWSKNFAIVNPVEQKLPSYNSPTSPPNLLYVSPAKNGVQPFFQVTNQSPTTSFGLGGFSILPVLTTIAAPAFFTIRGYPADGSATFTRRYKWVYEYQLKYPWKVTVPNFNYVKKVDIEVFDANQKDLPFTLDDLKISWQNPPKSNSNMQQPILQHDGF